MSYSSSYSRAYQITVRLYEDDRELLEQIAAAEKCSMSSVMMRLLRNRNKTEEFKADQLEAAVKAVADFYYEDVPLDKEAAHDVLHYLRGYKTVINLMADLGDKLNTTARTMSV